MRALGNDIWDSLKLAILKEAMYVEDWFQESLAFWTILLAFWIFLDFYGCWIAKYLVMESLVVELLVGSIF